ncbi:MAG TPA: hypothetical protein VE712_05645, partial [Actinomycetota bacterium]|nr:hypothetical protein [Actinomycetota bacterium]
MNVSPDADLVRVVDSHPAGTTFCLSSGTYEVGNRAVEPKSGTTIIGDTVTVQSSGAIDAPTKIVGNGENLIRAGRGVTLTNLDLGGQLSVGVVKDQGG